MSDTRVLTGEKQWWLSSPQAALTPSAPAARSRPAAHGSHPRAEALEAATAESSPERATSASQ